MQVLEYGAATTPASECHSPTPYVVSEINFLISPGFFLFHPKAPPRLSNPSPTSQTPSRHNDAKADSLNPDTRTMPGVQDDAPRRKLAVTHPLQPVQPSYSYSYSYEGSEINEDLVVLIRAAS